jgi:alpha-beta hydrolase superfamily lysophospholipase
MATRVVCQPQPHPGVGTQLVRRWQPEGAPPWAEVVVVHGLAEHSGRYQQVGTQLAEAGLSVRAFDLIGAGGTGGARCDIDDWGRFLDQVEEHVVAAREGGAAVALLGHSMGGTICCEYVTTGRAQPDLLVLSAPALAGGAVWQRKLAAALAGVAGRVTMPISITGDQLSRDPAVGEAYFADPLVARKATIRLGHELFRAMDRARECHPRIAIPTLVLHGGADTVAPPQATAAMADNPMVERRLYPGLRHEVFNEPEGPELVAEVVAWIKERVEGSGEVDEDPSVV